MVQLRLQSVLAENLGDEIVVDRFPFVIGRHEDCHHRLDFAFVSRRHCCFYLRSNQIWVMDLESANGTSLNGERLTSPQKIRHGDQVGLGPLQFRITLKPGSQETLDVDLTLRDR